ncbi:hypothetical protein SEA_DREAMTEAM1_35 [Mycobacterium phage DreamTeam1]|nr:hypothetical protein SEA_DREAMTEAM1_35 [Mycobacterium phage DreamTeam1]
MKIASTLAGLMIAAASFTAPEATADDYVKGCENIRWGFLGGERRTICDSAKRPDGSWDRRRMIWSPSYVKPARTTCSGSYSVTCTHYERREVDAQFGEVEQYVVTDDNVPQGEPGWLAEGITVGNA